MKKKRKTKNSYVLIYRRRREDFRPEALRREDRFREELRELELREALDRLRAISYTSSPFRDYF